MAESKSYTTRELAQLWNVSESTVKRWADGGELKCYRTQGGHRRFTPDHITEFQTTRGFEATGILAEPDAELPDLDTYLNQKKSNKIREALLFMALNNQSRRIRDLLDRIHIRGVTLAELYDDLILPVFDSIQEQLRDGQLKTGEQRIAAISFETGLYYFFPKVIRRRPNGNTALCGTPDKGSCTVVNALARILETEGWECLNLGADIPFAAMAEVVDKEPVNLVCLNLSSAPDKERLAADFEALSSAADKYRIPVALTGRAFAARETRRPLPRTEYFASLAAFRRYVARKG
jgi:excisionase family DNA binding protein